ncbi:MAG: 16S rRNA (adenine(1518)-N(6)/adenine(1519)-N(6))-dimethyltransferase RsmA [Acidobacteriia bacterium]|nr:16S rRNA (adenine(1518)-N(6)/adenine(1519)-N(6))-dimethyltransferase RsmA [Terriglobia bacterium]
MRYNARVVRTRRPRLGQHFLVSEGHRRRIIEALDLREEDFVIEIGAGRGAMTALLAPRVRHLVAIELDASLAEALAAQFQGKNVEILMGDILTTDLADLCRRQRVEKCLVFGNLPYYITSPIVHHLFKFAPSIRGMALLVQREVAERLTARPGSRAYGYLSVLAQLYSEPRIRLIVPPGAFSPPPKIQSALVQFLMRSKYPEWTPDDQARFLRFAKHCFAQKRKNLLNNLRASFQRARVIEALASHGLATSTRAEEMNLGQFADLWRDLRQL